jgi:hypothetical protein
MKVLRYAVILAGLLAAAPVLAQTVTDELEAARTQIQADRKAIVAKLMDLNEAQSTAFWPVYNEYREAVRKVDDKVLTLIKDYAAQDSVTDAQAQKTLDQWMAARTERMGLQKTYVKKFGKVLPANKLVRYYQIENKMDAIVQYDLAANIPLVQ